jgi:hypothetical protein
MKNLVAKFIIACILFSLVACSKKAGCPTNGTNIGAERLMSGEKLPKVKKFKA